MARVVVLGAGVAGHTAALYLRRMLSKKHDVVVVSPNSKWNWIPSNIWVGVGRMRSSQVLFPLAPIYKRKGIKFHQALATTLFPEGTAEDERPQVEVSSTVAGQRGQTERIAYDYLVNATGPKLNFAATPGLGPEANSLSVCTADHAEHTSGELDKLIAELKGGAKKRIVIGTGHGTCTCEGAAFEYTFNVEHALRTAGVRENAEVIYLTNEAELGDFGVGGLTLTQMGFSTSSKTWTESLFREREVKAILGSHVQKVEPNVVFYEQLDGSEHTLEFDFAMLLPPFRGADLKAYDKNGEDISDRIFAPNGFMKVDADYTPKPYEDWRAEDWPLTYRSPAYPNLFAPGIAFAPPHQISKPRKSPNGTVIAPAPPRTGMPAAIQGKAVAQSIKELIKSGDQAHVQSASMAHMGAACVASAGTGLTKGSAASMTMYPVVPDWKRYPATGRDTKGTSGEIGLSGHWIKLMLHYLFIYKAKARPFWFLIPE